MEDRKEILAKLYAIRAGISAVSLEKNRIVQAENYVEFFHGERRQREQDFERSIYSKEEQIKKCEEDMERTEVAVCACSDDVGKAFGGLGLLVLGAFIAISSGHWFILNWFQGYEYQVANAFADVMLFLWALASPLLALGGAALAIFGIWLLVTGVQECINVVAMRKSRNETIKSDRETLPLKIKELQADIENSKITFKEIKAQHLQREHEKKKELKVVTRRAGMICGVLEQQYGDFLNVRDWDNLDAIIYFFETGRADSIKEALKELDEWKRTEILARSIQEIGNQISKAIRMGLDDLQVNMIKCFSAVSDQLHALSKQLDSVESLQQEQNKRLGSIAQQMDFNNALQDKAHKTSTKMMKDVAYVKTLAENYDIKRRNQM